MSEQKAVRVRLINWNSSEERFSASQAFADFYAVQAEVTAGIIMADVHQYGFSRQVDGQVIHNVAFLRDLLTKLQQTCECECDNPDCATGTMEHVAIPMQEKYLVSMIHTFMSDMKRGVLAPRDTDTWSEALAERIGECARNEWAWVGTLERIHISSN